MTQNSDIQPIEPLGNNLANANHNDNDIETSNELSEITYAEDHPLELVLNGFLSDLYAVQKTNRILMPHVLTWLKEEHEKNASTLAKFRNETDKIEGENYQAKGAHEAAEMFKALREIQSLGGVKIPDTLIRSLFTQIFSEFDAFIGALLKVIYTKKSELLKNLTREITFADLLVFDDINAIKLDMLEKEIDSFRRDSYIEQFATLEKKFSIKTLRSFAEWGEFVELSQRRNILVHNGGKVSDQYLQNCQKEGYIFDKNPTIGEPLKPSVKYFNRAIIVMSKVAFMLTHTLWRKLFPYEVEHAHSAANNTLYELLKEKRWKVGAEIAKFTLNDQMLLKISDLDLRLRTINSAIAAKFSEDPETATKYLKSIDWTASYRDFKLAIAVLNDKFTDAAKLMKEIGKNGELIRQLSYHDWPLFYKFCDSPEFLNMYQEIYHTSFVYESVKKSSEAATNSDDFNLIHDNIEPIIDASSKNI